MRRKLVFVSACMMLVVRLAETDVILAVITCEAAFLFALIEYLRTKEHCFDSSKSSERSRSALLLFLAVTLTLVRYEVRVFDMDSQKWVDNEKASNVRCVVTGIRTKESDPKAGSTKWKKNNQSSNKTSMEVRIISIGRKKAGNVRCLLSYYGQIDKSYRLIGKIIETSCVIKQPDPARNPGCFDYRNYLKAKSIYHVASIKNYKVIGDSCDLLLNISSAAARFKESFLTKFKKDDRSFLRGIIFGETYEMDEGDLEGFRKNGTSHILAVSGLHIGLLYSVIRKLRKKAGILYLPVLFTAITSYAFLAMWSVSVIRAMIMIIMKEAGDVFERRYDMLTSLGTVNSLMILADPFAVLGISFNMSFLAMLLIAVVAPCLARKISYSVAVALSVSLGTMPYVSYTFNYLPLAGMMANVPVIAILTVLLPFSLVYMLVPVPFGEGIISILIYALKYVNSLFTELDFLSPDIVSMPLWLLILIYLTLFFICSETFVIMRERGETRKIIRTISIIAVFSLIAGSYGPKGMEDKDIVMVDVGQGDCIHLRYQRPGILHKERTEVMIDGGGKEDTNIGKKVLKPYLLKNGIRKLDLAYATHLHTDHYKGLEELDKEKMIRSLMSKGSTGDVIYPCGKEDPDNRIDIIYPDQQDTDTDDENKNSLIFKVHIKGITMLVTGDLGEEGEHALVEKYKGTRVLDADILKVCHHGSKYSSSEGFIDEVSPDIAVIGVGKNNTYGHPSPEVLERFKNRGIRVYETDTDGAIMIRVVDGTQKTVRVSKTISK